MFVFFINLLTGHHEFRSVELVDRARQQLVSAEEAEHRQAVQHCKYHPNTHIVRFYMMIHFITKIFDQS